MLRTPGTVPVDTEWAGRHPLNTRRIAGALSSSSWSLRKGSPREGGVHNLTGPTGLSKPRCTGTCGKQGRDSSEADLENAPHGARRRILHPVAGPDRLLDGRPALRPSDDADDADHRCHPRDLLVRRERRSTAALLLVGIFLLVGLLGRTHPARRFGSWLESTFLDRLPPYSVLKSLSQRVGGKHEAEKLQPALLTVAPETRMLVAIVEELPNDQLTVFVPLAPTPAYRGSTRAGFPARAGFEGGRRRVTGGRRSRRWTGVVRPAADRPDVRETTPVRIHRRARGEGRAVRREAPVRDARRR